MKLVARTVIQYTKFIKIRISSNNLKFKYYTVINISEETRFLETHTIFYFKSIQIIR